MNIEQLKAEKKRQKKTLQQIADLSGVPKRTVDDIFSGHTKNPRIDTMRAIEEALGIYQEIPNPPSTDIKPEYQRIFESQSPQRQEILLKMLEVLAGMTDTQLENTKGFFSVAFNYNEAKKKKPESL